MRKLPKRKDLKPDVDWDKAATAIEFEPWVTHSCDDGYEVRSLLLGSVFSIMPSGAYYLPFACSNVMGCPGCGGRGQVVTVKRRIAKKWQVARDRMHRLAEKYKLQGNVPQLAKHGWYRYYRRTYVRMDQWHCRVCDGSGSHAATLDELFRDMLEREAEEHGFCVENGEGDPCDLFLVQSRERQPTEQSVG